MKKIIYFECKSGAAGDMLTGALYELLDETQRAQFLKIMNSLNDEIRVIPLDVTSSGIGGTRMQVTVAGHEEDGFFSFASGNAHTAAAAQYASCGHDTAHGHGDSHCHSADVDNVRSRIYRLPLSDTVKNHIDAVYQLIADAEAKVHRAHPAHIHFHELGSLDALADIAGCALAIEMLEPDEIISSPVCVGNGNVRCAHGILPVPAPATAEIISASSFSADKPGMPIYTSEFDAELLTPTGAAILRHFVDVFRKEVLMEMQSVGYGFGSREYPQLSCVRAFLGQSC